MKIGRKILIALFFSLLIIELVILVPETLDIVNQEAPVSHVETGKDVAQDMMGVHLIEASEGKKEWELWAEKATSYKDRAEWNLSDIRVKFFGEKGVYYDVKGKHGRIETASKNLEILGEVVLKSSNGYRFYTNKVHYVSQGRVLVAPKKVVMFGPREKIKGSELYLTGNKMKTLLDESQMIVEGRIRGRKAFEDAKKVKIRSEEAILSSKSSLVEFVQNVVVDINDVRVTGPKAQFKYLDNSNTLEYVAFSGGVKMSDASKWATAENVKAYVKQNKFVFKGNPRLVQGEDELRGQEIVLLDGGDLVQVIKANANIDKENLEGVKN